MWQRKEEKRLRVNSQLSIIGNFTENIFARDEKSRILFVKNKSVASRIYNNCAFLSERREFNRGREKHSLTSTDRLKTRVKERVENGDEYRARKTFRRFDVQEVCGLSREKNAIYLLVFSQPQSRYGTPPSKRYETAVAPWPLKRSWPTVGHAEPKETRKNRRTFPKLRFRDDCTSVSAYVCVRMRIPQRRTSHHCATYLEKKKILRAQKLNVIITKTSLINKFALDASI